MKNIRLTPKEISRADSGYTVVVRPQSLGGYMVAAVAVEGNEGVLMGPAFTNYVKDQSQIAAAAKDVVRTLSKMGYPGSMGDATRERWASTSRYSYDRRVASQKTGYDDGYDPDPFWTSRYEEQQIKGVLEQDLVRNLSAGLKQKFSAPITVKKAEVTVLEGDSDWSTERDGVNWSIDYELKFEFELELSDGVIKEIVSGDHGKPQNTIIQDRLEAFFDDFDRNWFKSPHENKYWNPDVVLSDGDYGMEAYTVQVHQNIAKVKVTLSAIGKAFQSTDPY